MDTSRFWPFSLSVYGHAAVQEECLALQDRHAIDVNLLLFCAFAGAVHGALVPAHELNQAAALVGDWHRNVITPLRAARRGLKPFAAVSGMATAAGAMRGNAKALELEAERLEQMMLEHWSTARIAAWPRARPADAVAANIRTLFALTASAGAADLPQQLIAAAVAAAPAQRGSRLSRESRRKF
jgi:uncharacterized protein (TIGR02444 family)